jgi:hypothetical protein
MKMMLVQCCIKLMILAQHHIKQKRLAMTREKATIGVEVLMTCYEERGL